MRNSRYRFSRLVMVIAAILFMGFGVYVLVRPEEFLAYVGLGSGTDQGELTMLLGIALVGLAIHQATTSRNAADPAFRRAALLSVLIQAAFAAELYLGEVPQTTMRTSLAGVCAFFAVVYVVTLPIKPVGYKDDSKA